MILEHCPGNIHEYLQEITLLADVNISNMLFHTFEGFKNDFAEKDETCLVSGTEYPCNGSNPRTKEASIE